MPIDILGPDGAVLIAVNAGTLQGANLRGANLQGARLQEARLQGARLQEANLQEADLRWANLRWANLEGANLQEADLRWVNLRGANLEGANLRGANLRGANLQWASLQGVNLKGVVLPTGEEFEDYLSEVVPALLVAGGRALEDVATPDRWERHTWESCPVAFAFGARGIAGVPALYRPRAEQFVQLFDAGLIPQPNVNTKNR